MEGNLREYSKLITLSVFSMSCIFQKGSVRKKSVVESPLSVEIAKEFTHRRIHSSNSNSTDTGLEDNSEDPWAIVELPDNSKRWSGKPVFSKSSFPDWLITKIFRT